MSRIIKGIVLVGTLILATIQDYGAIIPQKNESHEVQAIKHVSNLKNPKNINVDQRTKYIQRDSIVKTSAAPLALNDNVKDPSDGQGKNDFVDLVYEEEEVTPSVLSDYNKEDHSIEYPEAFASEPSPKEDPLEAKQWAANTYNELRTTGIVPEPKPAAVNNPTTNEVSTATSPPVPVPPPSPSPSPSPFPSPSPNPIPPTPKTKKVKYDLSAYSFAVYRFVPGLSRKGLKQKNNAGDTSWGTGTFATIMMPLFDDIQRRVGRPDYDLSSAVPATDTIMSLGHFGRIYLKVVPTKYDRDAYIEDGYGWDFVVYENPFRKEGTNWYFTEPGRISVGETCESEMIAFPCRNGTGPQWPSCAGVVPKDKGGDKFDLADISGHLWNAGIKKIRCIMIEDIGESDPAATSGEGFDLDSVALLNAYEEER